jgi:ribosome maturation factor RimP
MDVTPMDGNAFAGLLEPALTSLGFELVDFELSRSGGMIRVFIDRAGGVNVDDCAAVSNHLTRLFAVEGIDYSRLEVSSPGLDRPLRRPKDFRRFAGERVQVRMRVPVEGRKNFVGILKGASEAQVELEVDGALLSLNLAQLDKARLVPNL